MDRQQFFQPSIVDELAHLMEKPLNTSITQGWTFSLEGEVSTSAIQEALDACFVLYPKLKCTLTREYPSLKRAFRYAWKHNEDIDSSAIFTVIFLSEMEEYGKPYFEEIRKKTPPDETQEKLTRARRDVLNQLVENKLLDQEIKKRKVEVSDKDIDAAVQDILKQNRITLNEMKMALAKDGMTLTTYRERLRDNIGRMRLISREINSKIVIHDEDIRRVYRERIQEYMIPLEVQLQQIFFAALRDAAPEKVAAIEKQAGEVRKQAKEGGDFSELARKFSQSPEGKEGGNLGFFKSKELIPELEEASFSLERVSRRTAIGLRTRSSPKSGRKEAIAAGHCQGRASRSKWRADCRLPSRWRGARGSAIP